METLRACDKQKTFAMQSCFRAASMVVAFMRHVVVNKLAPMTHKNEPAMLLSKYLQPYKEALSRKIKVPKAQTRCSTLPIKHIQPLTIWVNQHYRSLSTKCQSLCAPLNDKCMTYVSVLPPAKVKRKDDVVAPKKTGGAFDEIIDELETKDPYWNIYDSYSHAISEVSAEDGEDHEVNWKWRR